MTYGEMKTAVMAKIDELGASGDKESYYPQIPPAANEGMMLLATAGKPFEKRLELICTPAETAQRFELRQIWPAFYRLKTLYWMDEAGMLHGAEGVTVENGKTVIAPAEMRGTILAWCEVYPQPCSDLTADAAEIELDAEAAALLPLYVASQIFKHDDIQLATIWRNEFETGRESLMMTRAQQPQGFATIDPLGWW